MFNLNKISLQRGTRVIFDDASLTIFAKQKVGIIGANGSGKSTLFEMLRGELKPDNGELIIQSGLTIAHLSQETPAFDTPAVDYVTEGDQELKSIYMELEQAEKEDDHTKIAALHARLYDIDGYTAKSRAAQILNGLGFAVHEYEKPVKAFSGGWRMRLNLAQTLMSRSDVLLLDEPTNHLDLDAILWLEKYLKQYLGTLLLISHDREFLDATVDYIVHVEHRQFRLYSGNYSAFEKLRAEHLALQQALYEKQQKQIAHMMKFVDRFRYKASKAKQAQSRLKAINRMETISAAQIDSPFHFEFKEPSKSSNPLLRLEKVNIGYGNQTILKNVNLTIPPGARIGLLGPNGAGKSTFIKLLAGMLEPQQGEFEKGQSIKIGYYAQHQLEQLHLNETPVQHLQRIDAKVTEQQARSFLGGFAFSGGMALSPITRFSGGEKARLVLALLVWQAPNLLLLDEPTNHLDLDMRNALMLALQSYEGAMILVSHDRHLLRTSTDDFLLVANQHVEEFDGTIEDYQTWLAKLQAPAPVKEIKTEVVIKQETHEQREQKRHLESKVKRLEKELNKFQAELEAVEVVLGDSEIYQATDNQRLNDYVNKQNVLKKKIAEIEQEWLLANQHLEE